MTRRSPLVLAVLVALVAAPSSAWAWPPSPELTQQVRVAQAQAQAATGVRVPVAVVPSRQVQAYATRAGVVVYTGVPPSAGRGVTFHELTHEALGHPTIPQAHGVAGLAQTVHQEQRADLGAGFALGATGAPVAQRVGYQALVGAEDPGDHGTGMQRVATTRVGMLAGDLARAGRPIAAAVVMHAGRRQAAANAIADAAAAMRRPRVWGLGGP